jgi:trans-aconitate 2-methyltransferase
MTDWDGAEYRKVNSLQQWLADRALADLDLARVGSLLDVGCGDGTITAAIADRLPGSRVVGIDPSPRMIQLAPRSAAIEFEIGDVLTMGFDAEFDAVVSFNALHWVADQAAALRRIHAALLPRGRAMLVFVSASTRPSLESVAMTISETGKWARYFDGFVAPFVHPAVEDWIIKAVLAGFADVETEAEDLSWDFESSEAFAQWCKVGFGPWTDRLPDATATDAFIHDILGSYEHETGSNTVFRFMQLRANLS